MEHLELEKELEEDGSGKMEAEGLESEGLESEGLLLEYIRDGEGSSNGTRIDIQASRYRYESTLNRSNQSQMLSFTSLKYIMEPLYRLQQTIRRSKSKNIPQRQQEMETIAHPSILEDVSLETDTEEKHEGGDQPALFPPKVQLPTPSPLLRITRCSIFGVYQRIFMAVFLINLWQAYRVIMMKRRSKYSPLLVDISTAFALNLFIAVLIRQDYIINAMLEICCLVPFAMPLRIRRSLAKVYEYGGLHSGTSVCSALWFSLLAVILTWEYMAIRIADPLIMVCTFTIIFVLLAMLITAFPFLRSKWHNLFEYTHRFGGWIVLVLFWPQLWLFTRALGHQAGPSSPGAVLTKLPAFWLLITSWIHILLPWLRLRCLKVTTKRLGRGDHAGKAVQIVLEEQVSNCVVYRIADKPLGEWHSFACIPSDNGERGSLIVSKAGDWTQQAITNPKSHYWTRGIPTRGVLCMARIFRTVIIVTTGAGIGPCLGTMKYIPTTKCRVIWSVRSPLGSFGQAFCDQVHEVDPKAIILDSSKGRQDLVKLAYELYVDEKAEAIFCVSKSELTKELIYEMESRGVPAFGPIWDS